MSHTDKVHRFAVEFFDFKTLKSLREDAWVLSDFPTFKSRKTPVRFASLRPWSKGGKPPFASLNPPAQARATGRAESPDQTQRLAARLDKDLLASLALERGGYAPQRFALPPHAATAYQPRAQQATHAATTRTYQRGASPPLESPEQGRPLHPLIASFQHQRTRNYRHGLEVSVKNSAMSKTCD